MHNLLLLEEGSIIIWQYCNANLLFTNKYKKCLQKNQVSITFICLAISFQYIQGDDLVGVIDTRNYIHRSS